jgi:hypothetical protein
VDINLAADLAFRVGQRLGAPTGILLSFLVIGVLPLFGMAAFDYYCLKEARCCLAERRFGLLFLYLPFMLFTTFLFVSWGIVSVLALTDTLVNMVPRPLA